MPKTKPVLLVVLDGWGIRAAREANAIAIAGTPNMDALQREFPHAALETSGLSVGLPEGQMGNSEVGHTNLGAGRIVYQDLVRINRAVEDGSFYKNDALLLACRRAREAGGALHLLGLVSDGGVHSHVEHLHACLELARREGVARTYVHAFMDGRDTPPKSGLDYLAAVERRIAAAGYGKVATVTGRYWAMDRDKRWDRVAQAYAAMVSGEGFKAASGAAAMEAAYARGETDEFVKPTVVVNGDGKPVGSIRDGDAILFFNFRADRAREITRAFTQDGFHDFERKAVPRLSAYVCMTQYDETFTLPVAYAPQDLTEIFPEIVARAGLRQLRTAETEKYAHVTFFFNGGRETVFQNEDRILVPSPRDVKTYDEKPEMSAREVTDKLVQALGTGQYGFALVNYANPDMVGHTGLLDAAVKAVRVVDECVGRLWQAARKQGMAMLVTADHGNCEMMTDPVTGQPHTAHTLNPVPFILADPDFRGAKLREKGVLADVAPTALQVMGLPQPKEMKGLGLVIR
ncbi:2,3-bisphosphoglycerate-independent phosphoglycerate mutase [Anaeromyxobacter dehalogenans]|uniref:2,3-bisphosphoglycerate-independent phosphoglycerate mutase n=1 Tax=Anaeromyxobacter dehalogenans (strain 2CP-C) TaxID=290397 RepID=Q2IMH9_ANADE|nr:2,3-bisphosphoglycerate-independent phosphoglycerate mutase [Anaeromyxobacter dehalogenans]ABC80012.1 phosphoglycerate mutase [Anaeromyxobacter dehalogenans 2CP-C]